MRITPILNRLLTRMPVLLALSIVMVAAVTTRTDLPVPARARPAETAHARPAAAPAALAAQPALAPITPVLEHGGRYGPIVADERRAYVALHSRVFALDPALDPQAPPVARSAPLGWRINAMALRGDRLLAAGADLALMDTAAGPDVALLDRIPLRQAAGAVAWIGDEAWVAQNPDGLLRVDVSGDSLRPIGHWKPAEEETVSAYNRVLDIAALGDRRAALLLIGTDAAPTRALRHVVIVDLPPGAEPIVRSRAVVSLAKAGIAGAGDRVILRGRFGGISQIPVAPDGMLGAETLLLDETGTPTTDMVVAGTDLWLVRRQGTVIVINLSETGGFRSPSALPDRSSQDWRLAASGDDVLVGAGEGLFWLPSGSKAVEGPDLDARVFSNIVPAPRGLWATTALGTLRRIQVLPGNDGPFVTDRNPGLTQSWPCGGPRCMAAVGDHVFISQYRGVAHLRLNADDRLEQVGSWVSVDPAPSVLSASSSRVVYYEHEAAALVMQTLDEQGRLGATTARGIAGGSLYSALLDDDRLWWLRNPTSGSELHVHADTPERALSPLGAPLIMPAGVRGPHAVHEHRVYLRRAANVVVVDGRQPSDLRVLTEVDMPGTVSSVAIAGDNLWVHWVGPTGIGGLHRLDERDPSAPNDIAAARLDDTFGILVGTDEYAWVASEALQAYDASPLVPPPSPTARVRATATAAAPATAEATSTGYPGGPRATQTPATVTTPIGPGHDRSEVYLPWGVVEIVAP